MAFNYSDIAGKIADESDILINIANNVLPIEHLLTGGAYLLGVFFAIKALQSLKHHGEQGRGAQSSGNTMKEPLIYLMVAAVFIYFPTAFAVLMNTTFGYSSVLAYAPITSKNQTINTLFGSGSQAGVALARIIQLIGLAAFLRGWILISKSASSQGQQGNTGKGFTHIFGGILAMNIMGSLQILNNTLYGTN